MAEVTYFYPTREQNAAFKEDAMKAEVEVTFDRTKGAYKLRNEEIDADKREAMEAKLGAYRTPEAENAWAADREAGLASRAALKEAAATQGDPAKAEPQAEAKSNGIVVYPALSQRKEFEELLKSTESSKKYFDARMAGKEGLGAHYKVVTEKPEAFAVYQGAEAEARWKQEFEAASAEKGKPSPAVEAARSEATKRGAIFFDKNKETGFELPVGAGFENFKQAKLEAMRSASDKQIRAMMAITVNKLNELRDKETEIRAGVAGVPVEQFKAFSFEEQKAMAKNEEGKTVGLVGDDFVRIQRLQAGMGALKAEAEARGIGAPVAEKGASTEKGVETAAPAVEAKAADKQKEAPAAETAKGAAPAEPDAELAAAQAAIAKRRGQGR